ncbi:MAG: TonB-dependent receptor [Bacteroidales bacterium]|nr:TonB-dependent receptor [Bacteroidales bacterium]
MKQLLIIMLLFFISITAIQAQDMCVVRGKISDGETGEALIGATVYVENSDPIIATVTDYDGNFSLENVPSDTKKLIISYISYETKIIENLKLLPGGTEVLNMILEKVASEISEVTISANAVTNTESAINTFQKKSSGLLNGISSQQISKLGDSDAASALKRISGVSISDGKYVFVRGLSDRYSKVTLNGAEIPGLDPNKNTVQMDMFPSNIIDNIIVYKSFTPDLPASFTGGYVNVTTKKYPEKFTLQFSNTFAYNPQTNLRDDFLSYEGGKYDAFGIDDGTRYVPDEADGAVPFLYSNNNELDVISASFSNNMNTFQKKSFLNHSHSFSVGNQIKLFGKAFGFILAGSYGRNFKSYQNGIYARYNLVETAGASGVMNPKISEQEEKGEEEVIISLLCGLSYKFNNNNHVNFTVLRNSSGLKTARYREGPKPEDNIYMYEHTLGFQERKFTSFQLSGNNVFAGSAKIKVDWISSYTLSGQNEPDLRFFNYDRTDNSYQISYNAYPSPARFFRELHELNFDNKLNISIPTELFNKTTNFKTGAAFTYKSRTSDSRKFDVLSQGVSFNGNINDYLSDDNIGQNADDVVYGVYIQNDPLTDAYNSYIAQESIVSGYGMFDSEITKKFKLMTGLRYEYDYTYIRNNVESSHYKYVRAEKPFSDFLPVLNLKYSVNKNMNIRAVYTRTIARPAFREIAPYAYYDFKEGWRVVGNPELKRTLIDNVDLRWEKFGKSGDNFSASLFYKYFSDPIELIDDPRANNPEFHYVNIENSQLYGFEIEVKKHFPELNMPNFMFGTNFTFLKSEVELVENYGNEENVGLLLKRPMYGQAPWVLNSFVSYENKENGLSVNVAFNIEGQKLAVVTKGATPNIYKQAYPDLKFNISKNTGKRFNIKFSVNNILDQDYKKTYSYNDEEYIFQSYSLGRTYSFSVSYNID